ncbi:MAG: YceI family protein [Leptospiraceae bacterium]|nr:YceI family protein [Leptospiraceae bacterium]
MNFFKLFISFLLLQISFLHAQSVNYSGKITFIASSRFGKVKGEFQKLRVVVTTNKIGSQIFVDIASISTGNKMRDEHLKNEDFFHVAQYPQAIFTLISLTKISETVMRGTGQLQIKDKKKEITFPLIQKQVNNEQKYSGEIEIDRMEFGISYNSIINPISEKVLVQYEILEKLE